MTLAENLVARLAASMAAFFLTACDRFFGNEFFANILAMIENGDPAFSPEFSITFIYSAIAKIFELVQFESVSDLGSCVVVLALAFGLSFIEDAVFEVFNPWYGGLSGLIGFFTILTMKIARNFLIYVVAFRVTFWGYLAYFAYLLAAEVLYQFDHYLLYLVAAIVFPLKALFSLIVMVFSLIADFFINTAFSAKFFQSVGTALLSLISSTGAIILGLVQLLVAATCATVLPIAQAPIAIATKLREVIVSDPASRVRASDTFGQLTPLEELHAKSCSSRAEFEEWLIAKRRRDAEEQRLDMELARSKHTGPEWEGMWDLDVKYT